MARYRRFLLPAVLILLAVLLPFIDAALGTDALFTAITIAIFVMLALGLNIVVGFAGLLDLGFVAFYALGAYVVGWFASTHFNGVSFSLGSTATSLSGEAPDGIHISFWILLLLAGVFSAVCGMIIGFPTLRLRGDYLAIVTLGFGEIIPRFFQNGDNLNGFNLTNGTIGIKAIDSPGFPFLPDSLDTWQRFSTLDLNPWYYTILAMVLVTIYVNVRLQNSRLGRAWISVREDETAAAAMGINPVTTKLWAYALGALFGGFAGAFYGAFIKNIFPDAFSFNISILILCMVVLGGMGNIYGVILGAIALQGINFYLLPQLSTVVHAIGDAVGSAALSDVDLARYNFFIFGVVLVLMMLLRPEGIIPNRQRQEELRDDDPGTGDAMGGGARA
ncbi:MAG: Branched-chain amino acid transport system permease protein LivM [uncultured Rubrobacteraceae bacterium]|uniref:Branched-chain amino acid transport system permease protein LivM n=1 Tax=uncultured Rubrobacteraceae bacterium TaxID=349277 RepID=A0A6J4QG71_9ACTN|nr:MAG: Branched-chain amino acid transport system permease protein LivM [uncultured Rubrobacteraceae bacterium]